MYDTCLVGMMIGVLLLHALPGRLIRCISRLLSRLSYMGPKGVKIGETVKNTISSLHDEGNPNQTCVEVGFDTPERHACMHAW